MLSHELFRPAGEVGRSMLFLHGIYGAGRNWTGVARKVIAKRSGWGAAMVDLRGHGASMEFEGPHTIEAAARDVIELMRALDAPGAAIVGHSFGGKVALMCARLLRDEGAPSEIWVIDSTPDARATPAGSAWDMLGHLRFSSGPFQTRSQAVTQLELRGVDNATAQWVSSNLERHDDGSYTWRIDLKVMEELLHSFFATDLWDVVEDPPAGTTIHFIKASESSVLEDDAMMRVKAAARANGRVHLHVVKGGHWLNADNPDGVVDLIVGAARK